MSDLVGHGAYVYSGADVVGEQDIRNGVLHSVCCPVELIDIDSMPGRICSFSWNAALPSFTSRESADQEAERALIERLRWATVTLRAGLHSSRGSQHVIEA